MYINKYNASGNDFIIFHSFMKKDYSMLAKKLCNRFNSIGADGLIILYPNIKYDFAWDFYNCDGSQANMCGNGARACAHYAYKNGLASKKMNFITKSGNIKALIKNNKVRINLGKAKLLEENIQEYKQNWYLVDTGVRHLVSFIDDNINKFKINDFKALRNKYNANINIANINKSYISIRTYEKGVEAETLACGTGMSACFYIKSKIKKNKEKTILIPKSGAKLELSFDKKNNILFQGKVKRTFHCFIKKF